MPSELPTNGYVVLGLLSFGRELTGYELKRWADDSFRFFYVAPAMSQIYSELQRLEGLGYVRRRDDSGNGRRARAVFRITPAGRRRLRRWLHDTPFEPPALKHLTALRLFLGHEMDADRLAELLDEHRRWAEQMLTELTAVRAGLGDDPAWANAARVAEWGGRLYGVERDAAAAALTSVTPST